MTPATPQQAEKKAKAAAQQAVLSGASPQEARAIELQTYARESGGTVDTHLRQHNAASHVIEKARECGLRFSIYNTSIGLRLIASTTSERCAPVRTGSGIGWIR